MNELLEPLFQQLLQLLKTETGEDFKSFRTSSYFIKEEEYKYQVYDEAQTKLGRKLWKAEDIGTGKIQRAVASATITTSEVNNLINWRQTGDFKKRTASKTLEATLFHFFKNKLDTLTDAVAFEKLINEGLSYQFVAYLFFIKDRNQFLPISQERFDEIFYLIGRPDFKTNRNASWSNYSEFCKIIKQVQAFLKTKDKSATLLDAHSFLWILGNRNKEAGGAPEEPGIHSESSNRAPPNESTVESAVPESKATVLTKEQWEKILSNPDLTKKMDLDILQTLYSFQGHKASATQIGTDLGQTGEAPQSPINLEVGRYAKRIAERYPIQFTPRNEEKDKYWDFFFKGWYEGPTFIWQLKPELTEALISSGSAGENIFPDELPTDSLNLWPEGMKKAVLVNIYERNPKARQACIDCYGYICKACGFDFEKAYGKLGERFIHVHHLKPISQIGQKYQVDPIADLRPVCPNCHAMLHRGPKTLSIEELKILFQLHRESNAEL